MWGNVWPRFILNGLPFALTGYYLNKIKFSYTVKLYIWVTFFAAMIHIASWINVWPIVLNGNPEVILYVHSANLWLTAVSIFILSPPNKLILMMIFIELIVFYIPLFIVCFLGNNQIITSHIISETFLSITLVTAISALINKVRVDLVKSDLSILLYEEKQKSLEQQHALKEQMNLELKQKVKEQVDQIKNQQAELVQKSRLSSLGTLAAGIAHELNNSLGGISGGFEALRKIFDRLNTNEYRKDVEILNSSINKGLKHSIGVVESIYNHAGLNKAKFTNISMTKYIEDILLLLKKRIDEKNIKINKDIKDITIFSSPVSINQILMNLMTNAIEAVSVNGTIKIVVFSKDDNCCIEVIDDGIGIDSETLDKIFDPFFTTKDVGSMGLGMYIVKTHIESLQGKISINTKQKEGTTILIEIPKEVKISET